MSRRRSNRYFQSSLSARSGQRHEAGLPISLSVAMMPSRIRVGPTCVRSRPANIAAVADRAIGAATLPMHPVLPSVSLPLNGLSSLEEPASPHRRQRCRTRRRRSCRRRLQHERDAYRRADPGGAGSGPSDPVQWARGSFGRRPRLGRHPLPLSRRGRRQDRGRVSLTGYSPSARLVPRRVAGPTEPHRWTRDRALAPVKRRLRRNRRNLARVPPAQPDASYEGNQPRRSHPQTEKDVSTMKRGQHAWRASCSSVQLLPCGLGRRRRTCRELGIRAEELHTELGNRTVGHRAPGWSAIASSSTTLPARALLPRRCRPSGPCGWRATRASAASAGPTGAQSVHQSPRGQFPRARAGSARSAEFPWDAVGRNAATPGTSAVSGVVSPGVMCRQWPRAGPGSSSHRGGRRFESVNAHRNPQFRGAFGLSANDRRRRPWDVPTSVAIANCYRARLSVPITRPALIGRVPMCQPPPRSGIRSVRGRGRP